MFSADDAVLDRPVGGGGGGVFAQAWKLLPSPRYSAPYGGGPGDVSDDQAAFGTLNSLILSYLDASLAGVTIGSTGGATTTGSATPLAVTSSDGYGSYTFSASASWTLEGSYNSSGTFSTSDTEVFSYSFHETGFSPDGSTFTLNDSGHATLTIGGSAGGPSGGGGITPSGMTAAVISSGTGGGNGNSFTHTLYDSLVGSEQYDFQDDDILSTSGDDALNESDTLDDSGADSFTLSETQTEWLNSGGSITSGTDTYQWNYAGSLTPSLNDQATDVVSDSGVAGSETEADGANGLATYSLHATGADAMGTGGSLTGGGHSFSWYSTGTETGTMTAGGSIGGDGESDGAAETEGGSDSFSESEGGTDTYAASDGPSFTWSEGVTYGYNRYASDSEQDTLSDSSQDQVGGQTDDSNGFDTTSETDTDNAHGSITENLSDWGTQTLSGSSMVGGTSSYSWSQRGIDTDTASDYGLDFSSVSYDDTENVTGEVDGDQGTDSLSESFHDQDTSSDTPSVTETGAKTLGLYGLATGGNETLILTDAEGDTINDGETSSETLGDTDSNSELIGAASAVATALTGGWDTSNDGETGTDTSTIAGSGVMLLAAGGMVKNLTWTQTGTGSTGTTNTASQASNESYTDTENQPELVETDTGSNYDYGSETLVDSENDAPSLNESLSLALSALGTVTGGLWVIHSSDTVTQADTETGGDNDSPADQLTETINEAQEVTRETLDSNDAVTDGLNESMAATDTISDLTSLVLGAAAVIAGGSDSGGETDHEQFSISEGVTDRANDGDYITDSTSTAMDDSSDTLNDSAADTTTESDGETGSASDILSMVSSFGPAGILESKVLTGTSTNQGTDQTSDSVSDSINDSDSGGESVNLGNGTESDWFSIDDVLNAITQATAHATTSLQGSQSLSWGPSGLLEAGSVTSTLVDSETGAETNHDSGTDQDSENDNASGSLGEAGSSSSYYYEGGATGGESWNDGASTNDSETLSDVGSGTDTASGNAYTSLSFGVGGLILGGTETMTGSESGSETDAETDTKSDNDNGNQIEVDTPTGVSKSVSEGSNATETGQVDDQESDHGGETDSTNLAFGLGGLIASGLIVSTASDFFSDIAGGTLTLSDQSGDQADDTDKLDNGQETETNDAGASSTISQTDTESGNDGGTDYEHMVETLGIGGLIASAMVTATTTDGGTFGVDGQGDEQGGNSAEDDFQDDVGGAVSNEDDASGSELGAESQQQAVTYAATSTLSEGLGAEGTVTAAVSSQSDGETINDYSTDTETETLTETESDNGPDDDFRMTRTITEGVTTTDDSYDEVGQAQVVSFGAAGEIVGGSMAIGTQTGDATTYDLEGEGQETGSDTGFSLTAELSVTGAGSVWFDSTDQSQEQLTALGVEDDGTVILSDSEGSNDSEVTTAEGSETLTDMAGGPSATASYDSGQTVDEDSHDDVTTTLYDDEDGEVASGTEIDDFANTYDMKEHIGADGPSVSSAESNSDHYDFDESGTDQIGVGGGIESGTDDFTWDQRGTDSDAFEQEGNSVGTTSFWGTTYGDDHEYSLSVDNFVSSSWTDAGGDDLGVDGSITGGFDDYAWAKTDDLSMTVSDDGTAAADASGTESETHGEGEHLLTGQATSDYTYTDQGDDEIGTDGTGGSDDYTYDLFVSNEAALDYTDSGTSSVSGYESGGGTDYTATGSDMLSDHDVGTLSQDDSGNLSGWDSFDVQDDSSQQDESTWSDSYNQANSPTYSGSASYQMSSGGSTTLGAQGTETSVGTTSGTHVYPSYEFDQTNEYSDAYENSGSDEGEYFAGYADQYSGSGSNSGTTQVEGTYWSTTEGPNYVEDSQYEAEGAAAWQDNGYWGSDWAYNDWANSSYADGGSYHMSYINGTFSETGTPTYSGGGTGEYSSEFDGYWTTWDGWWGYGWGDYDGWMYGMWGYYGMYGFSGTSVGGQIDGLLATAEGKLSGALYLSGEYGYDAGGLMLDVGESGGSLMIGAGGFYDPYDTSGWWGVWNTHPGDIGYRRPADSSSGGGYGGGYEYGIQGNNLLTPGVIVSPAGLNGQIENASSYPMGNDPGPGGSSAPSRGGQWPWWEGTKAFAKSFFVDEIYGGARALATGEAGEALGQRAVAIVENDSGKTFTGTTSDYVSFGVAVAGDMAGTNQVAEAAVGYDRATRKELSAGERLQRGASGVAAISGNLAGGLSMANSASKVASVETAEASAARAASAEVTETGAATKTAITKACFPAGTLVATTEGHLAIEKVRAGDLVWAFDLVTSAWRPCRVLQTFRVAYEGHSAFVTVGADAEETVEATLLHPFWVVRGESLDSRPRRPHLPDVPGGATTPGRWVDAGDLRPGDQVLLRSGQIVPVRRVRVEPYHDDVYNLQVDELECYAVGWGGALVHNQNGAEVGAGEAAAADEAAVAGEAAAPNTAEALGPKEYARRFDTNKNIKNARKNGIPYDPEKGNGIPTTSTDIEPVGPDSIREMTGARAADSYIDIDITGKQVLRRRTKAGAPEIVIKENINPDDIVGYGKVKKGLMSSED